MTIGRGDNYQIIKSSNWLIITLLIPEAVQYDGAIRKIITSGSRLTKEFIDILVKE